MYPHPPLFELTLRYAYSSSLEAWLPDELRPTFTGLLVGFGQVRIVIGFVDRHLNVPFCRPSVYP